MIADHWYHVSTLKTTLGDQTSMHMHSYPHMQHSIMVVTLTNIASIMYDAATAS